MKFLIFCVFVTVVSVTMCDDSAQCSPWSTIEQRLRENILQVNCTRNENCTGMSCVLKKLGYEVFSSLYVNTCENPSSLEFELDIPKSNITHWKRKFYRGDTFSLTDSIGGRFQIQKEKNVFLLGLTLQIHPNMLPPLLKMLPTVKSDTEYPVFQNIAFPIACPTDLKSVSVAVVHNISVTSSPALNSLSQKGNLQENRNCSITNSSCPVLELCEQIDKSKSTGTCVCIPDFVRDKNGKCVYSPATNSTTDVPGTHTKPNHGTTSNTSLLLTAILVPIIVILIFVGLVFATIKFRICQHLRRRLRVQVYEHVLLGQDDENEDEDLNPIA